MNWLRTNTARVLTVVLLLQLTAYYALALRKETAPNVGLLIDFPTHLGNWQGIKDYKMEKETLDVLRADDTLTRAYADTQRRQIPATLFIAFFKTQRTGQSPHSPKNCLPGSGFEPLINDRTAIVVPGESKPITVNRYVTQKGTDKMVVLYWYQSHGRIVANEFSAKFWSVADAIRYNRSDTALVRVSVPVANDDIEASLNTAYDFTRTIFPSLLKQLPE